MQIQTVQDTHTDPVSGCDCVETSSDLVESFEGSMNR